MRVLGREADIHGQTVTVSMNQLYAKQEKYVLLDVAKLIATEKEALAVKLNDEGRHAEAMKAYSSAAAWVTQQGKDLKSVDLEKLGKDQPVRQRMFQEGGKNANAARKMSKEEFNASTSQNSGTVPKKTARSRPTSRKTGACRSSVASCKRCGFPCASDSPFSFCCWSRCPWH